MAVTLCPKCQGQKHVQTPPWAAGDAMGWIASDTRLYTCPVCAGVGVLDTDAASGASERERLVKENAALRQIVAAVAEADNSDYSVCYQICQYRTAVALGSDDMRPVHTAPCVVEQARALLDS